MIRVVLKRHPSEAKPGDSFIETREYEQADFWFNDGSQVTISKYLSPLDPKTRSRKIEDVAAFRTEDVIRCEKIVPADQTADVFKRSYDAIMAGGPDLVKAVCESLGPIEVIPKEGL